MPLLRQMIGIARTPIARAVGLTVVLALLLGLLAPSVHIGGTFAGGSDGVLVSMVHLGDGGNGAIRAPRNICTNDINCISFGTLPAVAEFEDIISAHISGFGIYSAQGMSPPPDVPPPVNS